jgi:hypothetical protein
MGHDSAGLLSAQSTYCMLRAMLLELCFGLPDNPLFQRRNRVLAAENRALAGFVDFPTKPKAMS